MWRTVGKGDIGGYLSDLRCLTWGKRLVLEDGKGRDRSRSRLPRGILVRPWGRREANALLVQVGKPRQ